MKELIIIGAAGYLLFQFLLVMALMAAAKKPVPGYEPQFARRGESVATPLELAA